MAIEEKGLYSLSRPEQEKCTSQEQKIHGPVDFVARLRYFLLTRSASATVQKSTSQHGAVMNPPTPSDLVWILGFTQTGHWIVPVLRKAVRAEWRSAVRMCSLQLGDESVAHQLMESAIQRTKEDLAENLPVDVELVRRVLRRHFNNAIRRERRASLRLASVGVGTDIDPYLPIVDSSSDAVTASHDLAILLNDTPPELQRALLMRYGARSRWEDVAEAVNQPKHSVRMKCQRELNRIRKKLKMR